MLRRQRRRALDERLQRQVPRWYSPILHLLGNALLTGGVVFLLATTMADQPSPWVWLLVPLGLLSANGVEYVIHRYPMHRRTRLLGRFFTGHTLVHHRLFDERDFDLRSPRDLYFVLTTVHTTLLSLLVLGAVYVGLAWLVGVDAAAATAIGLAVYAMTVEVMHLVLHLPEPWFGRWPLRWSALRHLREHHRLHHDVRSMTRHNFNLAFPITDWVVGTRHRAPPSPPDPVAVVSQHP